MCFLLYYIITPNSLRSAWNFWIFGFFSVELRVNGFHPSYLLGIGF
jgi:hypothetical protein